MKLNLFNKFIVAFISVGLVPVLFVSTYSAYLFQRETRLMLEDNYRSTAYYAARNIDNLIEKYNTISKLLYSYNAANSGIVRRADGLGFADILKAPVDNESARMIRYNDIINFLYLIQSSDRYITNVIFAEKNTGIPGEDILYTFESNNRLLADRKKFLSLTQTITSPVNQLIIIPTHKDDYFQKLPIDVFTIGRNYIDLSYAPGVDRVIGTLLMDIDISAIDDIFSQLGLYRHNEIRVLDASDNIIYSNGVEIKKEADIIELCGFGNWRIIIKIDYQQATHNIMNMVWLIYIIVIIVLLILLALSVVYSNVFSRPVRAILKGMKQVEEGNFNIKLNVKGQDEIRLLADGFMHMTSKLENYIHTSLLSKLRLREAELSALRARIKPHFLYNSLEIIRMNAIAHDDESTAELSFHLAEFMQALIGTAVNEVPLREELQLLRNYLAFIDIRYEGSITWEINTSEELEDAQVLSLMMQPIVENAIIHGIAPLGRKGHIDIDIYREENNLSIVVTDNGIGMDEKLIKKLNAQLQSEYSDTEIGQTSDSIGIKNVHDRLYYTYGSPYGITIQSGPGKKTSVTMLLPLNLGGQGEVDV